MNKSKLARFSAFIVLLFFFIGSLFPIYWTLLTSLRDRLDIFAKVPKFFGGNLTLENYRSVISDETFISSLKNSVFITVLATFVSVLVGSLAAYALARNGRFKSRRPFESWMILLRALPGIVLAVPLYQMVVKLGLYDNSWALVICYAAINLPYSVWLMFGFIQGIPIEIEESAQIDGASQFRILSRIILPLVRSGLGATTIFVAMLSWNEYLLPLILADEGSKTLPVYVGGFVTSRTIDYGAMAAAACLCIIPIALVTLLVQKQLIRGLSLGAVKE